MATATALLYSSVAEEANAEIAPRVVPTEFCVFRAGWNRSDRGDFLFDDDAAALVMMAWASKSVPLMMDYEHQSLQRPPIIAPASATEFSLELRAGELWAVGIKWTDRAREMLAAGEYRLFSPAFRFDEETRRITALVNVALTNLPALVGIEPLVAASANHTEDTMDLEKQVAALTAQVSALTAENATLKEKASGGEIMALSAALGAAKPAEGIATAHGLVALRGELLAVTGAKAAPDAIGVVKAWKEDASEVVALRARVAEIEQTTLKGELDSVLTEASKAGKVEPAATEALRAWAVRDGKVVADGLAQLKAYVGTLQPKVVTAGSPAAATPPAGNAGGFQMTDAQRRYNAALGIKDETAFAKWAAEQGTRA